MPETTEMTTVMKPITAADLDAMWSRLDSIPKPPRMIEGSPFARGLECIAFDRRNNGGRVMWIGEQVIAAVKRMSAPESRIPDAMGMMGVLGIRVEEWGEREDHRRIGAEYIDALTSASPAPAHDEEERT